MLKNLYAAGKVQKFVKLYETTDALPDHFLRLQTNLKLFAREPE